MRLPLHSRVVAIFLLGYCSMVVANGCKKKDNGIVATSISKMVGTKLFHGKGEAIDPGVHGMGPGTTATFSIQDQSFVIEAIDNERVKIGNINFRYASSDDVNHYLYFTGNTSKSSTMKYQYENGSIDFTYWDQGMAWSGATVEYWTP